MLFQVDGRTATLLGPSRSARPPLLRKSSLRPLPTPRSASSLLSPRARPLRRRPLPPPPSSTTSSHPIPLSISSSSTRCTRLPPCLSSTPSSSITPSLPRRRSLSTTVCPEWATTIHTNRTLRDGHIAPNSPPDYIAIEDRDLLVLSGSAARNIRRMQRATLLAALPT